MNKEKIGNWVFILGIIIAVVAPLLVPMGVAVDAASVIWGLVILGLLVGLLNITRKETTEFLIAAIALLAASAVTGLGTMTTVKDIIANIGVLIAPAAILVALKAVWETAKKK